MVSTLCKTGKWVFIGRRNFVVGLCACLALFSNMYVPWTKVIPNRLR
jgi:hypothetical protein